MPIDNFRPKLAFRVGVTGHRDLDAHTCQEIRPRVRATLELIKSLAAQAAAKSRRVYQRDTPAILRAISPLAEGADRIFAEEALHLGYQLECPLPFHRQEYRNDFAEEVSKRRFDELLATAAAVFELDGSREDAPAAYALVGQLVLDQCDILLAIWDGKSAKGAGGTADVVREARRRRIAVVWLHTVPGEPDTIFTPDGSPGSASEGIGPRIEETVWRLLLPPKGLDPAGRLDRIERLLAPILASSWRLFERTLTIGIRRTRGPAGAPSESNALRTEYNRLDVLATRLAGLYRGAFLLNYVLGVGAVLLAILGNTHPEWKWPPACESLLISIVISLIFLLQRRRWHLRMVDCRYLAEQFRIWCCSYPLGLFPERQNLPAQYLHAEQRDSWVEWHSRAVVRQAPMPAAEVTLAYVEKHSEAIRKWLRGQVHYHDRNAAKMERMDFAIHCLAWVSIGVAFLAALTAWLGHAAIEHYHPLLLIFTAGFPAASAAAHAISTQGEFPKLAHRSQSIARLLRSYLKGFDSRGESNAADLRRQTAELAQLLLDEVADWQILYRKPAPPPG
jgi:hypothetical protein